MQALGKIIVIALWATLFSGTSFAEVPRATDASYTYATPTRGGTGKYYFGREIAQVMGHRGAGWLERKSRIQEEAPDQAVRAMRLPPDAVVADIGAGTGYFTFRIAALIPAGRVYAVDIQPEMLDIIRKRSPSSDPPVIGLVGSTAITPTRYPRSYKARASLPMKVLLPTPGAPVTPTHSEACSGSGHPAASGPRPSTMRVMARASPAGVVRSVGKASGACWRRRSVN